MSDRGERRVYFCAEVDNLTSVQALATAIIDADRTKGINCAIVYDHEEIGSRSKQGAQSTLIVTILKKIYVALGYSETAFSNAIMDSLLISADVSHAIHPSYAAKNDPTNKAKLNEGFCIKEHVLRDMRQILRRSQSCSRSVKKKELLIRNLSIVLTEVQEEH